jgi:hypothetical protein
MAKAMRAAIYLRVSTAGEQTVENQRRDLEIAAAPMKASAGPKAATSAPVSIAC